MQHPLAAHWVLTLGPMRPSSPLSPVSPCSNRTNIRLRFQNLSDLSAHNDVYHRIIQNQNQHLKTLLTLEDIAYVKTAKRHRHGDES